MSLCRSHLKFLIIQTSRKFLGHRATRARRHRHPVNQIGKTTIKHIGAERIQRPTPTMSRKKTLSRNSKDFGRNVRCEAQARIGRSDRTGRSDRIGSDRWTGSVDRISGSVDRINGSGQRISGSDQRISGLSQLIG